MGNIKLRKRMSYFVISLLAFVLTACGGGGSAQETSTEGNSGSSEIEKVKFRIAHNEPGGHHTAKGIELFADLIEEKSGGKIEVSVFPSGQLYDDTSIADAITSGQVEMGMNSIQMWAGHIPAVQFFGTPLFRNYDDLHSGLENGIGDLLTEEFNKINAHPVLWADYGFGYYASTKEPLSNPDAFKGKRVRVQTPLDAVFIEATGGSPVTMGGGEVYQALEKNTIDAALSGVTTFEKRQFYQYTDNFIGPISAGLFPVTANLDWWNSLPEANKKLINEAAVEASKWTTEESKKAEQASIKAIESKGMKYVELDEESFAEPFDLITKEYIKRTGEVGEKIVDIAREVVAN